MFDVTTFLIRWLFLSNLARDVAEIQTLPCQPYYPSHHQQRILSGAAGASVSRHDVEEAWRDDCIRGILSYPSGMQRLLVLDAFRVELVKQLSHKLRQADDTLRRVSLARQRLSDKVSESRQQQKQRGDFGSSGAANNKDDPFLDADLDIIEAFQRRTTGAAEEREGGRADDGEGTGSTTRDDNGTPHQHDIHDDNRDHNATLVITRNGTSVVDENAGVGIDTQSPTAEEKSKMMKRVMNDIERTQKGPPSPQEVAEATTIRRDVRDYLPQLVSSVLHAPPAFDPNLVDPSQKLRQLILRRCLKDPSWGIELCWLLEAEVGRAWKTLFEHRQQTGRRLIIVMPAEKAAVLAKIGHEKREAFDLLQDAEQATAYGYVIEPEKVCDRVEGNDQDDLGSPSDTARLPSSLSLRRCSHFGDTMHFLDKLTKISMDLRMVPVLQRNVRIC